MTNTKYTVVAVGTGDPGKLPVWVGYLKAYIEKASTVKDRVVMPMVFPPKPGSFDGLLETIKAARPDMVTFTPHEDWNTQSMLTLCTQLKAWNAELPVVICGENPRNRMQVEAAEQSGAIDYLVHGEPEKPVERLLEYYLDGAGDLRGFNIMALSAAGKVLAAR